MSEKFKMVVEKLDINGTGFLLWMDKLELAIYGQDLGEFWEAPVGSASTGSPSGSSSSSGKQPATPSGSPPAAPPAPGAAAPNKAKLMKALFIVKNALCDDLFEEVRGIDNVFGIITYLRGKFLSSDIIAVSKCYKKLYDAHMAEGTTAREHIRYMDTLFHELSVRGNRW